MKSRIKKLLAAALALCLIAAMVPGAALAASTPTWNFSTVNTNVTGTEYHETLADAVDYVDDFECSEYKEITVVGNSVDVSGDLPYGITLVVPTGKTINVTSAFTVSGTLELNGTMSIARGQNATIYGTLEGSGTIVAAAGTSGSNGGTLSASGTISNSVEISVGSYANATLPANYTLGGELSVAANATAKVNGGTLDVTGSVTIAENGKLDCGVNVSGSGDVTNSGTISGDVTVDDNASLTLTGDHAKVGEVEVNGTLTVNDTYNFSSGSTLTGDGTLEVSSGAEVTLPSNYSFSGKIDVANRATLNVAGAEKVGSASLNGDVVLSKDNSGNVVYTVGTATVSGAVTIGNNEKLIVDNTLTVAHPLTVNGTIQVNGTVNINANRSLTAKAITGTTGRIYVSGELYNDSQSNAGSVKIQIVDNGFVYSKSAALGDNVENGDVTSGTSTYPNVWQLGEGSSYDITVVAGTHGTVSNPPASGVSGRQVTITASPADGYEVDPANTYYMVGSTRYDSIGINGNVCSFVMPENDVTVHINFKKAETPDEPTGTTYSISRITSTNGTFVVNANKADAGETVTITTSPNSGYKVSRVSVTGATATKFADNVYTFTMPAQNVTVSVTFERGDYTVSLTNYSYDDGYISLRSSGTTTSGNYAEGDEVTIYAFPDRGFHLRSLTITRTDNRQTVSYTESNTSDDVFYFTMPASNVTVRAYFTDGVYEITTDIDGRGSLAIRDENGNTTDVAEEGEEIRIYPSANNGYRLGDLYVTYTDSDDEDQTIYPEAEYNSRDVLQYYWFEMPEYDVEIYADFGEGDYVAWIDRNNIEHGSIRVSPNVADEDDTVSVYVTPDSGYQLDELVVEDEDGRDVSTTALASGTRYTFRMPDSDVTISATFRSRNYTSNFTDVPRTEWYYEAVSYVATEGLMNGVSATQFNPNGTASRAQIVTILWRLAGEPSALTGAFTDVPAGEYYSTAVAWASRQGIVTGVGNNRFEPNSNITREQLAVILYRYAQDAGYSTTASGSITGYYDYARVNGYARTALQWAVGTGLITGTSSTTLSPQDTATRAQVATILMRFCENIVR